MVSGWKVVEDFEAALTEYTGARYAVAVNSCTAALMLAVEWHREHWDIKMMPLVVEIPRRTYCSVPQAILRAGALDVEFREESWRGAYQLRPLPVWDCARRFTGNMYVPGQFQCVSFSSSKILGIEQGGAILHDDAEADEWFRRMRFDGRTPGLDPRDEAQFLVGHHVPMLPSIAAQALLKLSFLPKHNDDLPPYDYPDLSRQEW